MALRAPGPPPVALTSFAAVLLAWRALSGVLGKRHWWHPEGLARRGFRAGLRLALPAVFLPADWWANRTLAVSLVLLVRVRASPAPPSDDRMTLTIPTLARVDGVSVGTAPGTEEGPLRDGAMHVEGTGFPSQDGANFYIAGHRLGFPGTGSDRLFWNLDELETGDRVVLEDADGRRDEYAVFRRKIVGPREVSVAEPVPGKRIVSFQTCTLPDYAERLVVKAALVHGPLRTSLPRPTG